MGQVLHIHAQPDEEEEEEEERAQHISRPTSKGTTDGARQRWFSTHSTWAMSRASHLAGDRAASVEAGAQHHSDAPPRAEAASRFSSWQQRNSSRALPPTKQLSEVNQTPTGARLRKTAPSGVGSAQASARQNVRAKHDILCGPLHGGHVGDNSRNAV